MIDFVIKVEGPGTAQGVYVCEKGGEPPKYILAGGYTYALLSDDRSEDARMGTAWESRALSALKTAAALVRETHNEFAHDLDVLIHERDPAHPVTAADWRPEE